MLAIDAHLDLAWNALNWGRDITQSVSAIRRSEAGLKDPRRGMNTVSLPEMRRAEVAVSLATVLARAAGLKEPLLDYPTPEIASAMAQGQLAYYQILEARGWLRMIRNAAELEAHFAEWLTSNSDNAPLGYILSMEGADPIVSPADVEWWWGQGLRVVGLAHYGASTYAHGTGASGGVTDMGIELLRRMENIGMILDATHLSDESFWQAMEKFHGTVLASHNNCRSLVPGNRQFSDEQIRYLIGRGAVIGVALDSWMLHPEYAPGQTDNSLVRLNAVVDHMDHIAEIAGNARHVAIGSDLDGGFGREQSPADLDTIADLQGIPGLLRKRGYQESDVAAIMHGNWLGFFARAWADLPAS